MNLLLVSLLQIQLDLVLLIRPCMVRGIGGEIEETQSETVDDLSQN